LKDTLTVSEVTAYIKTLVDRDEVLSYAAISGEISNFKAHYATGHLYFSLKDTGAQIKAVMFRSAASKLEFAPKDGDSVKAYGRISVYPQGGQYQLYCESLVPDGMGALWLEYERLKKQLESEGLFDQERKKALPTYPKRVGVITSKTGAAVRDVISVLTRRMPSVQIVFCGASVQGDDAPGELRAALSNMINNGNVDVIIIGRGGGSAEDLWAFNNELLVRDITASPVPVISAVGHETDFTLSDFAADVRAPTPSAAAELAVPDASELADKVAAYEKRIKNSIISRINDLAQYVDSLASRGVMQSPVASLEMKRKSIDASYQLLCTGMKRIMSEKNHSISVAVSSLNALNPLNVLERGYMLGSLNGKAVQSISQLTSGDKIDLRLSDGSVQAEILNINGADTNA